MGPALREWWVVAIAVAISVTVRSRGFSVTIRIVA